MKRKLCRVNDEREPALLQPHVLRNVACYSYTGAYRIKPLPRRTLERIYMIKPLPRLFLPYDIILLAIEIKVRPRRCVLRLGSLGSRISAQIFRKRMPLPVPYRWHRVVCESCHHHVGQGWVTYIASLSFLFCFLVMITLHLIVLRTRSSFARPSLLCSNSALRVSSPRAGSLPPSDYLSDPRIASAWNVCRK